MNPFSQMAEQTLARDASIVGFAGAMLLTVFSFAPPIALKLTATVALFFSAVLILRAHRLTEDRVDELEAWRGLDPELRPDGDGGRLWARDEFEDLLLHMAKTASKFAVWFYCAGIVVEAVA